MKPILDIRSVQEGDLLYYGESLFVVSSIDLDDNIIYIKFEDGKVLPKKVTDWENCLFFRLGGSGN